MTTTDQTEFERIAALTIKANEAVAHELENGGDSHTCVVATMGVFQPEIDRLKAEVKRLGKANSELEADLDQAVGERDEYNDLLNTFAYTIAPQSVIGEHSSGNDPWRNALDLVTPAAKVDELEAAEKRVRKVHVPVVKTLDDDEATKVTVCLECDGIREMSSDEAQPIAWPCATIRALGDSEKPTT